MGSRWHWPVTFPYHPSELCVKGELSNHWAKVSLSLPVLQIQCQLHPGPALPPHSHGHLTKAQFHQDAAEMWHRTHVQAHPRAWNTNSTTRNYPTTPLQVLSCTAASEQDVTQEIPQSCSKSPAGITHGGSTGHSSHPGTVQAHTVSPGGNSSQSHPAGTDRRESTPLTGQPPPESLSWEQGQPQLLTTASMAQAGGAQSWHESCGTVPQHLAQEAGGARGVPRHCRIQVHPSISPSVPSLLAASPKKQLKEK